MFLSILFFLITAIGLGFLIDLFIKDWNADFIEKLVIRLGAGTLFIPIFGVLFNHLRIQIFWPIFLGLAVVIVIISVYYRSEVLISDLVKFIKQFSSFKIKKSQVYTLLVILIFAISAYMYIQGSFNYPWFENGDPYSYALDTKYISIHKTFEIPFHFTHFSQPYPQGYQIVMALLHQTNDSIYGSMKFFNALFVSLSILFFFFFARKLFDSDSKAFWATITLAAIPAWLSHFVFALNFNMAFMFLIFYALLAIKENKNWKYLAGLFFGAIILSHFYTSVVIASLLAIFYILKVLSTKKFNKDYLDAYLIGFFIGLVFWVPALIKFWDVLTGDVRRVEAGGINVFIPLIEKIISSLTFQILTAVIIIILVAIYLTSKSWFKFVKQFLDKKFVPLIIYLGVFILSLAVLIIPSEKIMYSKGSASRVYTFADFFIAQNGNMINNPIGIGWLPMFFFMLGLVLLLIHFKKLFKEKNIHLLIILTWVIFSFIGVMGASLSIGFVPFRMWTFFGMSLALVVGYSIHICLASFNSFISNNNIRFLVKLLFIFLILIFMYSSSFSPKYWHNTAIWPEHQIMEPQAQQLFIWMRDGGLPKDSTVLPFCNYPSLVLGYDMLSKPWETKELVDRTYLSSDPDHFFKTSLNQSLEENYNFLKKYGYNYTVLGVDCIIKLKVNETKLINRVNEMTESDKFTLVQSTSSELLFKIN